MSFVVKWKGADITDIVISYQRSHSLCTGEGTLTLQLEGQDTYTTWDELTITEDSTKKATYNISTVTKNDNITTTLVAENGTKRMGDYFVHSFYNPQYLSTCRYWIEKFLDEAGVSYSFNVATNGAIVDKNAAFGRDSVYSLILPLLQQSGWYITFDANNDADIGKLDKDLSNPVASFDRTEIMGASIRKNDKMSRNKAIVWGGMDYLRGNQIRASVTESQDWQIDSNDVRPILVTNSAIQNYPTAYGICWQLINEFSPLTKEKELQVIGFANVREGDVIFMETDAYTGTGMITSLDVSVSADGAITRLVLDERCPRIFAFFAWDGYVYAGTWGSGVYRKPLEVDSWSSFSSGLANLYIKDLYVQNGVFVCVADDGYAYYNLITDLTWRKINHGIFVSALGADIEEEDTEAVACSIDDENGIIIGYIHRTKQKSWVLHFNALTGITRKEPVIADDTNKNIEIYDLDNTGEKTIIGVAGGFEEEDFTKGIWASCYIPTDGRPGGGLGGGGNTGDYGQQHDHVDHFHNMDYFFEYPELLKWEFHNRGRTTGNHYGAMLTSGKWNYYANYKQEWPADTFGGSLVKMNAYDRTVSYGVNIAGWQRQNEQKSKTRRADEAYSLYDENTIIAISHGSVYKCEFDTGTATLVGTLTPSPANYCDGYTLGYGPYIVGMWGGNGPITFLYWYSNIDTYDIMGEVSCHFYVSTYDGSLNNLGEIGEYPYGNRCKYYDPQEIMRTASYHTLMMSGQPSLGTVSIAIYSAELDMYFIDDDSEIVQNQIQSFNISIEDGSFSSTGIIDPPDDFSYLNNSTESFLYPVSRKMYAGGGGYTYSLDTGGIAAGATPPSWDPAYQPTTYGMLYWGGGLATIELQTGAITVVEGSFPISNTTHYPIDNISNVCSDTDGAMVYYKSSLTSGVIMENEATHIHKEATNWVGQPQTINDYISLVGNRIVTGAETYTISGYLVPDDAPESTLSGIVTTSGGFVLRDNFTLGTLIPSGYAGFTTIISGIPGAPHIELSKSTPTIAWTESSGIVPSYMYSTYTNEVDDFTGLAVGKRVIVDDVRVYTHFNASEPESGGFKVAVVGPTVGLKSIDTELAGEFFSVYSGITISGINRIETSNYDLPPFFFAKTGSGAGQKFYQRNPTSSSFFENSSGLPASNITIIRLDDGM